MGNWIKSHRIEILMAIAFTGIFILVLMASR